jgi:hypothetical protein
MNEPLDLTGHKYNRLTVMHECMPRKSPRKWWCKCDCGNQIWVVQGNLRSSSVKSCGCLKRIAKNSVWRKYQIKKD